MRRIFALGALCALPLTSAGCDKITARDLVREGNALYDAGQFEEAIAKFDEAEKHEPDGVTYLWNRACAHESFVLKLKDAETPEELKQRKASADGALKDFRAWFDRLEVQTEADEKALKQHKLALLAVDQRCDELIAHWQGELKKDPKNEGIYVNIAKIYEDPCGQIEKADEWYNKRANDFPKSARAWYELAVRKFDPLMPDPETALPYNANIGSDERLRIADEVIADLNKATAINANNRDPYVWRAMAHTQKQFARVYLDPPAGPQDKLEALNARQDSMLAWKEQKAVCDIDKISDCPLDRTPEQLFSESASYVGKDIGLKGKIVAESVKPVDAEKHIYSFDFQVFEPVAEGAPPPDPEAPPPEAKWTVQATYAFIIPEAPEPREGEPKREVDLVAWGERVKEDLDRFKKAKGMTLYGELSADGKSLKTGERPPVACCPEAPLSPEDVASDQALRAEVEAEMAAAAQLQQDKKGRGR